MGFFYEYISKLRLCKYSVNQLSVSYKFEKYSVNIKDNNVIGMLIMKLFYFNIKFIIF